MHLRTPVHRLKTPLNARWVALAIAVLLCPIALLASEPPEPLSPAVADALRLLDLWIDEQVAARELPGLSIGVVHGDELVWARGYGLADLESATPATPQTLYRIGSVTKLFTATAVMQLRDRGLLRLDDPVRRHLPWFEVTSDFAGEPEITLWHLLTHTSGLPREGAFPYWTTHQFPSREELIARLPSQRAIYPPGTHYKYSNLGMALLGEVVAAVSGQPYAEYLEQHVFAPLGMGSTTVRPDAEDHARMATAYFRRGAEAADGGRPVFEYYDTGAISPAANIVSSVEDLARFAALQFRDGTESVDEGTGDEGAGGGQILRASTLREMHRPQWIRDGWQSAIGLGFRVSREDGEIVVSHGGWVGGNRSHLLLVPAREIAVVVLTNADDANPGLFASRALATVGPALAAAAAASAPAGAPAGPSDWMRHADAYTGTYTDPWGWETEVMVLDGALVLYDHDYPPSDTPADGITRLEPVVGPGAPAHTFRLPDGETLRFQLDADGRVERLWKRSEYLLPAPPPQER